MVGVLLISTVVLLIVLLYVLGFRLGSNASREELLDVRLEARRAERELTDLTRQAFITMAEHALTHREAQQRRRGQ